MSDKTPELDTRTHENPSDEKLEERFGFQLNGDGFCTFSDGSKYVGEFKDGLFHGQGSHEYADGSTYVGEFKSGCFDGRGTFTNASGTQVNGEFARGIYVGAFDLRATFMTSSEVEPTYSACSSRNHRVLFCMLSAVKKIVSFLSRFLSKAKGSSKL